MTKEEDSSYKRGIMTLVIVAASEPVNAHYMFGDLNEIDQMSLKIRK